MQEMSQCERCGQEPEQCFCPVVGNEIALLGFNETEWAATLCVLRLEDFYVSQMPNSHPGV